ncbi:hypothetical protein JOC58_003830 [Paenibacillus hunanensis]|jgi:hypothetical protein|uniref:YmiA family membrane protein n=1 Tax=Paenibacillus hunanensis TaxID=539262 RepID=A0ABU1J3D2_9BACL|nr:hypothetical protein [Paenibacillus hunanensis]
MMKYQGNPSFAKGCLWGTALSLLLWAAIFTVAIALR